MDKGQVEVPFQWIYIIVAGATILLFFIGLVTRQQGVAEQQLSLSVTQKLDGIFTGAALSEQTVNVIDVPELDFFFTCDSEGISEYRVAGGSPRSLAFQPFFAPAHVRSSQLITWTLDFNMPFKVSNLLLMGTPSITSFLIYQDGDPQSIQLKDAILEDLPEQFQAIPLSTAELHKIGEARPPLKLIFLTRIDEREFQRSLAPAIHNFPDDGMSILRVELSGCSVTYYQKKGDAITAEDSVSVLGCIGEKNPPFYAALFSGSAESYNCGMEKAFKRMLILADIYAQRAQRVKDGYTQADVCWFQARPAVFGPFKEHIKACSENVAPGCMAGIAGSASEIHTQNIALQDNNCAALY